MKYEIMTIMSKFLIQNYGIRTVDEHVAKCRITRLGLF